MVWQKKDVVVLESHWTRRCSIEQDLQARGSCDQGRPRHGKRHSWLAHFRLASRCSLGGRFGSAWFCKLPSGSLAPFLSLFFKLRVYSWVQALAPIKSIFLIYLILRSLGWGSNWRTGHEKAEARAWQEALNCVRGVGKSLLLWPPLQTTSLTYD